MAVTSTASPDEDIRREVLTELKFDAEVGQSEIGVIVDDQVLNADRVGGPPPQEVGRRTRRATRARR